MCIDHETLHALSHEINVMETVLRGYMSDSVNKNAQDGVWAQWQRLREMLEAEVIGSDFEHTHDHPHGHEHPHPHTH
jgi:hypothetical protein